jgi:hypothetical protein
MKKAILLCAAMTISAPAFAQTAAPSAMPAPTGAMPQADLGAATATQAAPTAQQPMAQTPAAPADTAQAATTAPAPTTGQPASGSTQVAQVVNTEFATYDKNKDGVLSKTEFGDWMVALKSASDPSTKADAPATKTWVGQAFASADKDRSKTVSKTELTGFLSQGQS